MKKINVLHILKNSLPFISGSTIRAKNILEHQKRFANVNAYTGYNFESNKDFEVINGIKYFRTKPKIAEFLRLYNSFIQKIRKVLYKFLFININSIFSFLEIPISIITKIKIRKLVRHLKIDIIHQHSQHQIGKFSLRVAKKLKIPYIYEVRTFLENGIIINSNKWKFRGKRFIRFVYNNIRIPETKILQKADLITTLCSSAKSEIVDRGINENKIYIIPNGIVNRGINEKKTIDSVLPIIGYIGTINKYEGISILIKAISYITKFIPKIKLYLVGSGNKSYLNDLRNLTKDLNCQENIIFIGSVPYDKIKEYYKIIDIIVIPRLNRMICRQITPIKPMESMAYGTLVIASNLPALRYVITPYKTGLLFTPESITDLYSKIMYIINRPYLKLNIEHRAKKHVEKNFSWSKNIIKYKEIYQMLI